MAGLPRMRTVQQTVVYFKEQDPETVINEYFLRTMIRTGRLSVIKAGTKSLINLDKLVEYLNDCVIKEEENQQSKPVEYGKIRRVEL